jgi:hypothetical protein
VLESAQPQQLQRYIFAVKFCTPHALPSVLDLQSSSNYQPQTQQPSRHMPFSRIFICNKLYLLLFYHITTVRHRAISKGWPQAQTHCPSQCHTPNTLASSLTVSDFRQTVTEGPPGILLAIPETMRSSGSYLGTIDETCLALFGNPRNRGRAGSAQTHPTPRILTQAVHSP